MEVPRAGLAKAALAGRITNEQGARALHMSVRQFRRVKKRFREGGARGLLHVLRGRPGNRHLTPQAREQIATLMTTTLSAIPATSPATPEVCAERPGRRLALAASRLRFDLSRAL